MGIKTFSKWRVVGVKNIQKRNVVETQTNLLEDDLIIGVLVIFPGFYRGGQKDERKRNMR